MTKKAPSVSQNPVNPWSASTGKHTGKWLLLLIVLAMIAVGAVQMEGGKDPVRDPRAALSDDQRRAMDVRLFNELAVRTEGWVGKTREMRYRLIDEMGRKGFEPAELALRLFDFAPGSWRMRFDRRAYQQLKALAESGDPSAQCLTFKAIRKWKVNQDEELVWRYIKQAADQDHPACTATMALAYLDGHPPYAKNPHFWKKLILKGGMLGDQIARLMIARAYGNGKRGFPLDIGKARCWFLLAEESDTGKSDRSYLLWWEKKVNDQGLMKNIHLYSPEDFCE